VRHHFTWILDLENKEGRFDIEVHVGGLAFKVELAGHGTCEDEYKANVNDFLDYRWTALRSIGLASTVT
jgi:hypothetical protein